MSVRDRQTDRQTDGQTDKVYSYIDVEKSAGARQTNSKGLLIRHARLGINKFFWCVLYCAGKPIENAAYGLNINHVKLLQKN